jgi:hypothetical protein
LWLRQIILLAEPDADCDAILLARFVKQRDEAAFTTLACRHGPHT